jgi:hypothetical protein
MKSPRHGSRAERRRCAVPRPFAQAALGSLHPARPGSIGAEPRHDRGNPTKRGRQAGVEKALDARLLLAGSVLERARGVATGISIAGPAGIATIAPESCRARNAVIAFPIARTTSQNGRLEHAIVRPHSVEFDPGSNFPSMPGGRAEHAVYASLRIAIQYCRRQKEVTCRSWLCAARPRPSGKSPFGTCIRPQAKRIASLPKCSTLSYCEDLPCGGCLTRRCIA